MSSTLSDDQVMQILKQGFPNADQIQFTENSANEMRQNLIISDIIELTLNYRENGEQMETFLILKVPKQSDATALFDELAFYTREAFMYDVMIPRISKYLDTSLTPFCFKTIDSRIIILENLTSHDFKKDESGRLHLEQCLPIIKALADFHAASHKVGQLDPHLLEKDIFQYSAILEWRSRIATFWEPILVGLLATKNESSLIPAVKQISLYLKREDDDFRSKIQHSNFKFPVLNQGDFHSDNILLKYDSSNTIEAVKIIDFQSSFWSTPVCDFMNFLILCSDADELENNFRTLLEWYLQCLNEKLKITDCSAEYTQQDFFDDIKSLNFCSVLNVMSLSFLLLPSDPNQLLDAIYHKKTENAQYFIDIGLKHEMFTNQILSCLKFCEKLGLLETSSKDSSKTESQEK